MASHWRQYRLITVKDRRFRWTLDFHHPTETGSVGYAENGKSWAPDRLFVRPEDHPHPLLTVTWPACRGPVITPALVRTLIAAATQQGWPDVVVSLELSGVELTLP